MTQNNVREGTHVRGLSQTDVYRRRGERKKTGLEAMWWPPTQTRTAFKAYFDSSWYKW